MVYTAFPPILFTIIQFLHKTCKIPETSMPHHRNNKWSIISETVFLSIPLVCLEIQRVRIEIYQQIEKNIILNTLFAMYYFR